MRRKLVKQGRNALTVTLPADWIKKAGLTNDDDVEIEESGKKLVIGTQKDAETEKISFDTKGMSDRAIRWLLSGFQKGGYDEIEIFFDRKEVIDIVNDVVKNLYMGFAIIEQTDRRCLLKSITKDMDIEFDNVLRRAFLVALSMGDNSLDLINKGRFDELKSLINLEKTNNQLTNFCERILNKRGYRDYRKTCFMYTIVWNLEKICDDYKYICEYLSGIPKVKTKVSDELIGIYGLINSHFRGYNSIFLKFDMEKLVELNRDKDKILSKIIESVKSQASHEAIISSYLMSLMLKCEDFSTSLIMMNRM